MSDLPPTLREDVAAPPPPTVYYHNWLYSVVPVSEPYNVWETDRYTNHFPLYAYLVGYCRNCNQGFSEKIPNRTDGTYFQSEMNVQKEGCVGP